jgi:hypothetical protein
VIENTWSNWCAEKACFVRVVQLQAFFFWIHKWTKLLSCFNARLIEFRSLSSLKTIKLQWMSWRNWRAYKHLTK